MPAFGDKSKERLETCHEDLQRLCNAVIPFYDFSVIEGHRSEARQKELFAAGKSKLDGVNKKSKHQEWPARAVDLLPFPGNLHGQDIWEDKVRFAHFVGIIRGHAEALQIPIRIGFDWDGDGSCSNNNFVDYPHIELVL